MNRELSTASVCQKCKATKKTNQSVQTIDITSDNISTNPVESGNLYETEVNDVVILTPSGVCRPKTTTKEMLEQQTALKEDSQVKLPKNDVKGMTTNMEYKRTPKTVSDKQSEVTNRPQSVRKTDQGNFKEYAPKFDPKTKAGASKYDSRMDGNIRKTLLMGDSTTSLIDRRKLIRIEIISKSMAFTIEEAREKISRGGDPKENIIYVVGINDLKNRESVEYIMDSMKCLVRETREMYPSSKIFLCSVLPVQTNWIDTTQVVQINSFLENIPNFVEDVYFIDSFSAFTEQQDINKMFEQDGYHPSLQGTLKMAACIRDAIKPRRTNQGRISQFRTSREYAHGAGNNAANRISKNILPANTENEHLTKNINKHAQNGKEAKLGVATGSADYQQSLQYNGPSVNLPGACFTNTFA